LPSDRFSYSRLQLFDQCLAKYRFIYLDGRSAGGESIESYLGGRLHEALEWLYREPRRRRGNILFDDLLNQYRSLWKEAWHGFVHIVQTGWQTDDYYQLGQRCLAGFYRRNAPFDEPVEGTERVISFTLDRDDLPGTPRGSGLPVAGTARAQGQGEFAHRALIVDSLPNNAVDRRVRALFHFTQLDFIRG